MTTVRHLIRPADGSVACQARGCGERAEPYAYTLDFGVEVEVFLCRRHERELLGREEVTVEHAERAPGARGCICGARFKTNRELRRHVRSYRRGLEPTSTEAMPAKRLAKGHGGPR